MERAVDVFYLDFSKVLTLFSTAFSWINWQDTGWMSGLQDAWKIIKQVALKELYSMFFTQADGLSQVECSRIDNGPQGVQNLHRWPRWWHLNLIRFAGTKLADKLNTLQGRTLFQIDLDKLEGRASKTSMKFNKDKRQIPHLEWNTQKAWYRISSV